MNTCPKCGSAFVVTRYHPDRGACGYTRCDGLPGSGEHLQKRCETCHYAWYRPTNDARVSV